MCFPLSGGSKDTLTPTRYCQEFVVQCWNERILSSANIKETMTPVANSAPGHKFQIHGIELVTQLKKGCETLSSLTMYIDWHQAKRLT